MSLANQRSYSFDATLQLKDAGLVAASAAAQVASAAAVLDVGASPFLGVVVIDVTAIEVDSSDEVYELFLEGSNSSTFAGTAAQVLGSIKLGHATPLASGLQTSTVGRYELLFVNVQADTVYRYLRMYTKVAGTIATGINYKAFVGRLPPDGV
jgi:ABC-type enterochelin transport system permease subunit